MNKITYAKISGYDAAIAAAVQADVHVVARAGALEDADVQGLCDELVGLACTGRHNLVLDLSAVTHIDYRGFGRLVACAKFLRASGGELKLCGLSDYHRVLFRASGHYGAFEYFETAEAAAADFALEASLL
ncbi:MAG TPA: STAS domain-containing protein [Vulgatibacter sp.]